MPAEINKSRRRFQLRLTTIMLLIAIAATAVGWWADHSRLVQQLRAQDTEIRVFALQNSDAAEIAAALQKLFPDTKSDPTRISSDNRTNGLIVSASSDRLDVIEATLMRLDR